MSFMPEAFEQHFAQTPEEKPKSLNEIREERALALAEEIREIQEKIKRGELVGEEAIEGYQRIIELTNEIKKLYERVGWRLEGELSEEDVLLEYQAEGKVYTANFSPEGDKVVIGTHDKMKVISLTATDEEGKIIPRVLAEYQAEGKVYTANFSPEGDKVVIGTFNKMKVISLTATDEEGKIIPRVLAEYQAEGEVWAVNFSPEGNKIVIECSDEKVKVLGTP